MNRVLAIDIETFSPVDLLKSGVYPYASHPDFKILLFAYAFDNDDVQIVDLANGEVLPDRVIKALNDPTITKTAHNANFERVCISNYFDLSLPIGQWECTAVKSAMLGLPLALGAVAKVLKLPAQKMVEGRSLINFFSKPCLPNPKNGHITRYLPKHDRKKWETFKSYCRRDVEVERMIRTRIEIIGGSDFIPDTEKALYILDQEINDRGVLIDTELVANAIRMDAAYKETLTDEATELTNLNNPNSVAQLKEWIAEATGEAVESLTKETVLNLLQTMPSDEVTRVLQIRQEMAKTSVKKYQAMQEAVCADGRVRGLLQFYGANRTGRWAGRLVQVQNLPQNHLSDLDLARQLVKNNDLELLEMCFGNVPDTLSQLIRTAFIPKPGHTFIVADFSAIEARVIAWLADEKWRMDVFATHGKIYEASASQMFKVPIEEVTKGSVLRQKGKIAELALGYQGGVGALEKMGAAKMGIAEDELQGLVDAWRAANPHIVRLWKEVEVAAKKAVIEQTAIVCRHGVSFIGKSNRLIIKLPSGRELNYLYPKMGKNKFDSDSLTYEGMNQTTKQWEVQETYGGKLTENIVQAIARDCLAYAMARLKFYRWEIVMHVHDEVILEVEEVYEDKLRGVCDLMSEPIPWAPGLPLRADGYVTNYYKKD